MRTRRKYQDEEDKMEFRCVHQRHLQTTSGILNVHLGFGSFYNSNFRLYFSGQSLGYGYSGF